MTKEPIKTFLYESEWQISSDPPTHAEASQTGRCHCPRQLRILMREYTSPYVRILAVCDFHGQEVYYYADFASRKTNQERENGDDFRDAT